ncbi:MAG: TolC family protein [Chlamydiae bacterium]|nr:TolC family protein [Chlamydiota bacterium]MBI3276926.1 TolC family protein [Chlamydiota bacterium]
MKRALIRRRFTLTLGIFALFFLFHLSSYSETQISEKDSDPSQAKAFIETQIQLAKKAYRAQHYQEARSQLEKVLEVDPQNYEAQQWMRRVEKFVSAIPQNTVQEETLKNNLPTPALPEPLAEFSTSDSTVSTTENPIFYPKDVSEEKSLSAPGIPLTLEQCIMIARANSLSVKIAREEALLAQLKITPARRALWPSADVFWKETRGTTTGQDFIGREITLEVQKPLLTWGKNKALFLQAKTNWEIAKRNLQKEVTELDFKVEQAYFIFANALKEVTDLESLYKDANKSLAIAEKRRKLELSSELEWLKSKSKVDEILYRLEAAKKDLILAQLTMSQIMDPRDQNPFTVRTKLGVYGLQTSLEQCIQLALKSRSDLAVNEFLMEYNKLGQKISSSEYKWNVNLEGSAGVNDEAFITEELELEKEWFVGVKVTKPFGSNTLEDNFIAQNKVPSVGQTTATEFQSNTLKWYFWNSTAKINIKESDIKYLKSIDEYVKKRNSVIFEVKKNFYEYEKASQQLTNNTQKLKVADREFQISVARLELNEILDSELLDTLDRFSKAKSEYGQASTGYYTAIANLNKSMGLTDYFDLKRGLEEAPTDANEWKKFINAPGEVGSLPNTAGYKEVIEKLEGKKPWWKLWGNNSSAPRQEPQTTQQLVEQTLEDGIKLYNENKYPNALAKFQSAQKLDPNNAKANDYLRKTKIKLEMEKEDKISRES